MHLNHDDKRRYSRHLLLERIGEAGQEKLLGASVLVVGAGGLGAAALSYLAAAGVGRLGVMDHDKVELSNLNRQVIHETGDIGRFKTASAADRIAEINPECRVEQHTMRFGTPESKGIPDTYGVILDCSDNFETRFALNAACLRAGKPLISAAVRGFEAQISTYKPFLGPPHPCYRCLVPEIPPGRNDCAEGGVVGPLVGVMGSMQALETLKELLGVGASLSGILLRYNALDGTWRRGALLRDPGCKTCGA